MGVMPIPCPHFKITIVKRSQGQSAVAGAAYQSGERLFSEYDQKTKFYNKKKELVHAEIMLPSHAPPGFADRATLWNAVEAVENQWNSQLARRIVLAFPVEVPKERYLSMIKEFCQEQFVSKGMIADFAMVYDDKKAAGERLLLARQEMPNADMMLLGTYRGFELNIRFDSFKNEHQAVLRAELSYPVSLGDDARGNITRLDNAIDNFADRIADAENALQNLEQQKQAAEVEVAKPFAQEEELAEKSARLAELNALLNIDRDRSSSQDVPEESEETEAPATRPSVLAALEEKVNQPEPVKPFKSYLDKEGR